MEQQNTNDNNHTLYLFNYSKILQICENTINNKWIQNRSILLQLIIFSKYTSTKEKIKAILLLYEKIEDYFPTGILIFFLTTLNKIKSTETDRLIIEIIFELIARLNSINSYSTIFSYIEMGKALALSLNDDKIINQLLNIQVIHQEKLEKSNKEIIQKIFLKLKDDNFLPQLIDIKNELIKSKSISLNDNSYELLYIINIKWVDKLIEWITFIQSKDNFSDENQILLNNTYFFPCNITNGEILTYRQELSNFPEQNNNLEIKSEQISNIMFVEPQLWETINSIFGSDMKYSISKAQKSSVKVAFLVFYAKNKYFSIKTVNIDISKNLNIDELKKKLYLLVSMDDLKDHDVNFYLINDNFNQILPQLQISFFAGLNSFPIKCLKLLSIDEIINQSTPIICEIFPVSQKPFLNQIAAIPECQGCHNEIKLEPIQCEICNYVSTIIFINIGFLL